MKFKIITQLTLFMLLCLTITGCGGIKKPDWSKPAEPDGRKRAQQNVIDGQGIKFKTSKKNSGNFSFATSNPLWRASLDVVDFMGLSNIDYAGGLIITDWYSEQNYNESIKITLRFLSSEIRVDAIDVDIRKRECLAINNCVVKKLDSDLENEIIDKILRKAAKYDVEFKAQQKESAPKKVFKGDN